MSADNLPCPTCGNTVSKTDVYCKNCGARLTGFTATTPTAPSPPEPTPEALPLYERRFSVLQRYYRLLVAPSEAMKDIALAPDYKGYFGILVLQFVLTIVVITLVLQKIQFTGTNASQIYGMLSGVLALAVGLAVVLASFLLVIRWLAKSFIVRLIGDSGSSWNFSTAASVTAYAYIADVVVMAVGMIVAWFMMPTLRVNTTDTILAIQQMNDYRAQLNMLRLTITLPISLLGVIWKSYLGGLGTHFGTNGKCSKLIGFVIFLVLSLFGLIISFFVSL